MKRKGVPCDCADGKGCCGLKEKLAVLWDRTIGSILKINDISPDGDGKFTIEAGSNIALSETGTGNGIRIDTTGGVSYYESGDSYVDVNNDDLEISVKAGVTGGLALQDDLDTVTDAIDGILDGTVTVPKATDSTNATNATNATYLGSSSANVGSDTKPVKIVNGQAVEVTNNLIKDVITTRSIDLSNLLPNFLSGWVTEIKIGDHTIIYEFADVRVTSLAGYDVAIATLPSVATTSPRAVLGSENGISGFAFVIQGDLYVKLRMSQTSHYTSGQLIVFV